MEPSPLQYDTSLPICTACGLQHPHGTKECKICLDDRQFVPIDQGQQWNTLEGMGKDGYSNKITEVEEGLWTFQTQPKFGIGQRSFLHQTPGGNVMWDCISYLDPSTKSRIVEMGGIRQIVISHPHFLATSMSWAEAFDATIYLHQDDQGWVVDSSAPSRLVLWEGDELPVFQGIKAIRIGGHFPGSAILYCPKALKDGQAVVLAGDSIFPVPHRKWVSYMFSFPNLLPLPAFEVTRIKGCIEKMEHFDRLYGPFATTVIDGQAKEAVLESAERYLKALAGEYHHRYKKQKTSGGEEAESEKKA